MFDPNRIAIVLDPQNLDPAFGAAESAVLRGFHQGDEETFNEAFSNVEKDVSNDVHVYDLIEGLQDLFQSESSEGCSDDLTVVSSKAVEALRSMLKKIGEA